MPRLISHNLPTHRWPTTIARTGQQVTSALDTEVLSKDGSTTLPNEIWYSVVDLMADDPDALRTLSLINEFFRAYAQPLLFRHVVFDEAANGEPWESRKRAAWRNRQLAAQKLQFLVSPRIAPAVRGFSLRGVVSGRCDDFYVPMGSIRHKLLDGPTSVTTTALGSLPSFPNLHSCTFRHVTFQVAMLIGLSHVNWRELIFSECRFDFDPFDRLTVPACVSTQTVIFTECSTEFRGEDSYRILELIKGNPLRKLIMAEEYAVYEKGEFFSRELARVLGSVKALTLHISALQRGSSFHSTEFCGPFPELRELTLVGGASGDAVLFELEMPFRADNCPRLARLTASPLLVRFVSHMVHLPVTSLGLTDCEFVDVQDMGLILSPFQGYVRTLRICAVPITLQRNFKLGLLLRLVSENAPYLRHLFIDDRYLRKGGIHKYALSMDDKVSHVKEVAFCMALASLPENLETLHVVTDATFGHLPGDPDFVADILKNGFKQCKPLMSVTVEGKEGNGDFQKIRVKPNARMQG